MSLFFRCFLCFLLLGSLASAQDKKVSFGRYRGGEAVYAQWFRFSEYMETSDATQLAVDIYRPAEQGVVVKDPLPVIWTYKRFHRSRFQSGKITTDVDTKAWLRKLLNHGYVIVAVDARGGGASLGNRPHPYMEEEAQDVYDITEWLAQKPWCNGKVGMYGSAFEGSAVYMGLAKKPPHLTAVAVGKSLFDFYDFSWNGGIFAEDYMRVWGAIAKRLDTQLPAPPTDDDTGGKILKTAKKAHKINRDPYEIFSTLNTRDSVDPISRKKLYLEASPSAWIDALKENTIPVFQWTGWLDLYVRDTLLWHANMGGPNRLLIGKWHHQSSTDRLLSSELHRWFDHWLKDIDTNVDEEAPIRYYLTNKKGNRWFPANSWPLPDRERRAFYLDVGPSETITSANDGKLVASQPGSGMDGYTVNYETTSGRPSRWSNGYGLGNKNFKYGDRTPASQLGLTYTTDKLEQDLAITGHPIVHLWIEAKVSDLDFFVYLEEIDGDEKANYLTEGFLRASHRKLAEPPFFGLDLPWHRSFREDLSPLAPDQPSELVFDLMPVGHLFKAGSRIRITITCADKGNRNTPELKTPPSLTMHRGGELASRILLPVVPLEPK